VISTPDIAYPHVVHLLPTGIWVEGVVLAYDIVRQRREVLELAFDHPAGDKGEGGD